VSASETVDTWWYQKNSNGTNITFTPNVTLTDFVQGTNNITVWANDTLGNENSTTVYFTVDTVAPTIAVDLPENQTYTSLPIDLNVTTSDATTWTADCLYNLDGGTNTSLDNSSATKWFIEMNPSTGTHQLFVYCNDSAGNSGLNDTVWFSYNGMELQITRTFWPEPLMAEENESVLVNTTVKVNETDNDVYQINITDEIPWDFNISGISAVTVYFVNYSTSEQIDITTNTTINISILDPGGSSPILLMVNITNVTETDADCYIQENDSILIVYTMTSSEMEAATYRLVYTNVTITDNNTQTDSGYLLENITAYEVVLRGYKTIDIPDLSNPQNLTVEIILKALGGPTSNIYVADYLPDGALIFDLNVTLWNNTLGQWVQLTNGSDFYVDLDNPVDDVLPGGESVDIYEYNFTYGCTNWDCNLRNNDSINITYNVTFLGGGSWVLPTITAGYDPQYQKHIKTEMYASASVPSFDVLIEIMTSLVKPGESVKALLRMLNVGGPKAKVDVFVTYSAKTMDGELINERSDTFAVVETKERELDLRLPIGIEPGMYTFEAFVTYTGREALSTDTFEVTGGATGTPSLGENMIYIVIIILIVVIILLYFRLGRKVSKIEHSVPTSQQSQSESVLFLKTLARLLAEKAGRPLLSISAHFSFYHFIKSLKFLCRSTSIFILNLGSRAVLNVFSTFILTSSLWSIKKGGKRWYMPSI